MSSIMSFIDIFLHLDKHLSLYMTEYGIFIYLILFVIVFCETGFVVTPFLPGDSLVFATGALAVAGSIKVAPVFLIFCIAAIAGDTVNYSIGHFLRDKVLAHENIRFIKREYIERTDAFFKKHGGQTIIIARFIPIIRTFAPFVAGVGTMPYRRFILFNAIGGISWVSIALFSGYFFGNISFVKNNFSMVILGIVVVSLIPVVITFVKNKVTTKKI
ncbi:DedA family protein [Desulfitobacterium sp.]|uniref:DedA family protein n=1 Tax=Desulfitobacterium sp. TaxID=49981 RepID=UPI002C651825|nr:DedA family protein [Desulfitobacterium sp.]HVJ49901.1 DedA family protein [Desulfitobacterium sp.]